MSGEPEERVDYSGHHIGRWQRGGGGCADAWILGLLTFLIPQDQYFTVGDVGVS